MKRIVTRLFRRTGDSEHLAGTSLTGRASFPFAFGLAGVLALSGCASVGPNYVPPATKASASWSAPLAEGMTATSPDSLALSFWWKALDDPILTGLVEKALAQNRDIKAATARVREARAQRGMTAAEHFPTARTSASASGSRTETDDKTVTNDMYKAGFDASWEIDIFGGTRRAVEAADAQLGATIESLNDVLVTVAAEVALNYIDVRSYQSRIAIAEANLAIQNNSFDIARWRAEAGLTTELDVEQARYALEQTRASLPALSTGLAQAKHRLAVLCGQNPSALDELLKDAKAIPVAPVETAVGVPADALRRRPDVRQAERQLAARTAEIGVAKASRYPSFTLSGSTGLESLDLAGLFSADTWLASIASNIGYTLFDAGRIRRTIEVKTAAQEEALASYEAAVLAAEEEVENALVAFAGEQVRHASLKIAAESAEIAVSLVTVQYNSGQKDFQALLEAQRSLLNYQDQLASSGGEITANLIRLYKALGGGWTPLAPATIN